ncbi:MAG: flagellar hook basal-body protein [Ignavibacteriota bacterium]|jgi:flagellar basal body rod protein FlgG|nr:MAG: flagellar hook basal-body protein [Ignavibacterium sp.]MBL1153666.1 flagellar hook basal-body protein [Ignavibacteriota bacterium]MCO6448202.1 flagellar hook basal-body protein [Ignavibacterium album]MCZ2267986.1 flagellar hook basal-body protein [Ignavibacteriales bacterium]MDX9711414.1 flagellar hook basal-body protein [Ignavibacteriaceae bacterium]
MIKGIYQSARSLLAANKNMERISSNLANLNTVGFKREGLFTEMLKSAGQSEVRSSVDTSQGDIYETSNPLDFAISGEGLFTVRTANGYEFTRKGNFRISDDGFLVDESGNPVMGKDGDINMLEYLNGQQTDIKVSAKGELSVNNVHVADLLIVKIDDYEKRKMGLNFSSTQDIKDFALENEFSVRQGYLEESNVNPMIELENMISISKDYETAYKMVTYLDSSLEKTNDLGRI